MRRTMRLQILLPTHIVVDQKVSKIVAEAENGYFCMLPRHIDFVAALAPSILYFSTANNEERFYAIKQAVLVKCGQDVRVSTFGATQGTDLNKLKGAVVRDALDMDEHERSARSALARLEAGTIRRFMQLEEGRHE